MNAVANYQLLGIGTVMAKQWISLSEITVIRISSSNIFVKPTESGK